MTLWLQNTSILILPNDTPLCHLTGGNPPLQQLARSNRLTVLALFLVLILILVWSCTLSGRATVVSADTLV